MTLTRPIPSAASLTHAEWMLCALRETGADAITAMQMHVTLYAYTQGSAYAQFDEKHKGKLIPGYDADFILVDRDLYKTPARAILHSQVQQTFVAGENVYP